MKPYSSRFTSVGETSVGIPILMRLPTSALTKAIDLDGGVGVLERGDHVVLGDGVADVLADLDDPPGDAAGQRLLRADAGEHALQLGAGDLNLGVEAGAAGAGRAGAVLLGRNLAVEAGDLELRGADLRCARLPCAGR